MRAKSPGPSESRVVDSVMRALDFVEENMGQPIGVEEMAKAAFFSLFYFSRIFSRATGHAPYDYLMRRRVAAAADNVVNTERSLTEIALDWGFEVPDSFTRAFRRCFGRTPSEARRDGSFPRAISRTRIERSYVAAMLEYPPSSPSTADEQDLCLSGDWEAESGKFPQIAQSHPGSYIVTTRGTDLRPVRVFSGKPFLFVEEPSIESFSAARGVPEYPLSATRVPAGKRARFRVEGDESRLSMILEFAYRTWFSFAGYTEPPSYDIVEIGKSGIAALELPLDLRSFQE